MPFLLVVLMAVQLAPAPADDNIVANPGFERLTEDGQGQGAAQGDDPQALLGQGG